MQEPLFVWPSHSPVTILITLFLLLCLIALAHLAGKMRRAGARRRRLAVEMTGVREVAVEKGLSKDEWLVLEDLVLRRSPGDPMRTVTVRQRFNACVTAEMDDLARDASTGDFAGRGATLRDIRVHLGLDHVPVGQPIESTRDLHRGQSVWMSPVGPGAEWVPTRLALLDEAHLQLRPVDSGLPSSIRPGSRVRCRMWREDDARYVFESSVAEVRQDPPEVLLMHSVSPRRVQSRAHFRIHFYQSVTFGIVGLPPGGDAGDISRVSAGALFRGNVTSLSAGGVAIVAQHDVPVHAAIRFRLDIPGHEPLDMAARVVSTSPLSGGRHMIRAAFLGIGDDVRDVIARHVILQQQQAARGEKGWPAL